MIKLRKYQSDFSKAILDIWDSNREKSRVNVMGVMPTGAGKTATFSDIIRTRDVPSVAIAHRQELIGQISLALARNEIRHSVIGASNVVKLCTAQHMEMFGRSYVDPNSRISAAGVDTIISRKESLRGWAAQKQLWVMDEAHHVLKANKWGAAVDLFVNAEGLGVTASPKRADGRGLGKDSHGVFDDMVEGPTMRQLINQGYLTDYRIFVPPSDFKRPDQVGGSGDYTQQAMHKAVKESKIVGDIVEHYLRLARGKLGVTFVPDIETAEQVAREFNAAGVPAAVVSSKTPDADRVSLLKKFKSRQLLQLVNVDLFGEGFDLPAIEVISFGRPTESLGLYIQQFGRVLRLLIDPSYYDHWEAYSPDQRRAIIAASTKPKGIVIDHVGNVERHKLPDSFREWSLAPTSGRGGGSGIGVVPTWACKVCLNVQERIYKICQDCGHPMPEPVARSGPEFVDGDLVELDVQTLEEMRQSVDKASLPIEAYRATLVTKHVPEIGQLALVKKHAVKLECLTMLRESIAWWAGYERAMGRTDSESYRKFYYLFGVDVMTAQTLGTNDLVALKAKVDKYLSKELAA